MIKLTDAIERIQKENGILITEPHRVTKLAFATEIIYERALAEKKTAMQATN